jgi:hypothetical protein
MMELAHYQALRVMSGGLFGNSLVVPVTAAILHVAEVGDAFKASQLREQLSGRAADNQIREVLENRLETCEAVEQFPYLGRPHARTWQRLESPLWPFIESWVALLTK